ncbi:PaaI family thioesterase [Candidatus Nanopelagicales bacterium]|nr:PaaI family thioesterase [Candidatus Nanopelagicales bacterium]
MTASGARNGPPTSPATVPAPAQPVIGETIRSRTPDCFGCGERADGLGMELMLTGEYAITGRVDITEAHQGAPGLAHGGILSAAFDEVLGAIPWYLIGDAVTVQLNVSYKVPVPVGSQLLIQGQLDKQEGRKVFVSGVAQLPDGKEAALAEAIFVRVPSSHFTVTPDPQNSPPEPDCQDPKDSHD